MLFFTKKKMIIITLLSLIILAFFILIKLNTPKTIQTVALPVQNKVVILDAGHRSDQIMELQATKE